MVSYSYTFYFDAIIVDNLKDNRSEGAHVKLKIDYLSFAVIIFVVLFIFRVGWFYMFIPEQATVAHNGQINIATSSILNDEYMYIEGEWLVENNGTQRYVSSSDKPQPYDGLTVASMDVTLDEVISIPLTLHIPRSSYQTKVYIDNVLIKEQSDRHGISYQSYKASFVPKEQRFNVKIVSEGERVEYPFSKRYLAISSEKGVDLRINTNNSLVIFTASIFMMLVISLTVFYIFIESSKLVLYLIVIIAFPTLGELYRILLPYFEWIKLPFFVEEKLFTLLYFLSQFVLLFLFKYLIKRNNAKLPYINSIIVLYALTFIVLALLPVEYIDIASVYLIVFYFVWISYCLNHLLRQVYVSRYELYSLIYIMLSILSGLIWGIVKNNVHYFIPFYTYDYLGLQLGFTGIWLNRYLQNAKTIEKSDRKKEQFLQQVSEQLTMPLSKLELAIDKQRDHLTNQRDKDELLEMTSTVRGMGFILNNWLDYTRLKSESHKAIMQSVDVVSTIRYVCSVIQNSLEVANLNLTLKVESNLSTIIGDAKLLSQVLYNIIYIQLEQMQHNNLQISCSQFNHKLVIQIEDATRLEYNKYKWLAEEDIPIAIQICKAIIDDQGGSLESKDNGFEISLKVQQEQEIVLQGFQEDRASYNFATKTKTYTNESMSILAYSTDLNTNTTLYSVIDSLGDRLTQVHDYNEFVTKYNNNAWDLIILDSTLNDSTSLDILSMIRARFSLIDLPVLVVLVPTQDYFISTYFKNGMNDYVTRPLHAVE